MNMNNLKKLLTRDNLPELILGGISALYILGDIKPPQGLAGLVDTPMGTIVLLMAVVLVGSPIKFD